MSLEIIIKGDLFGGGGGGGGGGKSLKEAKELVCLKHRIHFGKCDKT